jgi:origin recognition complex subunit 1
LSAIPDVLPCRDKERNQIRDYLVNGLQSGGSSSSLYISGMPGTGKTATTLEVVKSLKAECESNRKVPKFEFIHINAMSLTNPNLVYTILNEKITGNRCNPTSSAAFLDEFFKKGDKLKVLRARMKNLKTRERQEWAKKQAHKLRVVLIDELDALVTKKQTLLYNLFDWPCHSHSRLLVVAIANTMDLPEKL